MQISELAERLATTTLLECTDLEYNQEDPKISQFFKALRMSGKD